VSEIGIQYETRAHEIETSLAGVWLFLASEVLFFGGVFLVWTYYQAMNPAGFAAASRETELAFGSVNTFILFTSSAIFATASRAARRGSQIGVLLATLIAGVLGALFLLLKFLEWHDDLEKHLFPGPGFSSKEAAEGGAQLFFTFYWVGTVLHGLHLTVGLGLLSWIFRRAWRGDFSGGRYLPVEAVALYWSFVDVIWLILYPLIYLSGR
jgi:cytochrome c oxidase subunit 3